MRLPCFGFVIGIALASFAAAAETDAQQGAPPEPARIAGAIRSFDPAMRVLTVQTRDRKDVSVALAQDFRVMYQVNLFLTDLQPGDYVGATILKGSNGAARALEVHVFPGDLRGAGEGLYPAGESNPNRAVVNGTVAAVTSTAPNRGSIDLSYRGSAPDADGLCSGRAPADPSAGCQGRTTVEIVPGIPIIALREGDESLLVPGAAVLLSVAAGEGGALRASRLSVERDGVKPIF
jgi:hypothetical protein